MPSLSSTRSYSSAQKDIRVTVGIEISEDVPVPDGVLVGEGIRVPERVLVLEYVRELGREKLKLLDPTRPEKMFYPRTPNIPPY